MLQPRGVRLWHNEWWRAPYPPGGLADAVAQYNLKEVSQTPMPSSMQHLVLKEGDIFIVTDEYGNIPENTPLGLYYHDTRYLSLLNLEVNGADPELLQSTSAQNFMSNLQFANTLFHLDDGTMVLPQTISIRRNRLVRAGLYERIGCMNYNRFPVTLTLLLEIGADFRDMFDVRGFARIAGASCAGPCSTTRGCT